MKGYSFRSLTDLVLKIFKTKVNAGTGLSGGGSLEADRTLTVNYGTTAGTAAEGNDSRLSDSREWTGLTISQAEAEVGTATTRRAFTAQRVRQAIVAWWNSITGVFGRDLVTSASNTAARDKLGLFTSALRWPAWAEVTGKPTTFTPSSHSHPWSQITGQPVTATRWPSLAEVTGTPANYPTTWGSVAAKPAQATRWPTFAEVAGKPAIYPTNWAAISDKPVVQTVGTSTTNLMSQKAVTDALNRTWPVGVCYTQYPDTPTPETLFGGTWKPLFNDEGVFFRTEGGRASGFGGGVQGDDNKSHAHTASSSSTGAHTHTVSGTAAGAGSHNHTIDLGRGEEDSRGGSNIGGIHRGYADHTSWVGNHTHSISGTAASAGDHAHTITVTASGGSEARPINRTIRVWQRTA